MTDRHAAQTWVNSSAAAIRLWSSPQLVHAGIPMLLHVVFAVFLAVKHLVFLLELSAVARERAKEGDAAPSAGRSR